VVVPQVFVYINRKGPRVVGRKLCFTQTCMFHVRLPVVFSVGWARVFDKI
jgi:hypothetical protein